MSFSFILDWKCAVALGAVVCGIILCSKMEPDAAERVSIGAIDACKELVGNGNVIQ